MVLALRTEQLTERARALVSENRVETVLMQLLQGGNAIWEYVHSLKNHASIRDAVFPIYSISKSFISVLIAKLVASNRLALDSTLAEALPDIDLQLGDQITVRHLLQNNSGITNYGPYTEYKDAVRANPEHPWTDHEFLEFAKAKGPRFEPGRSWDYSNTNYLLLRLILERMVQASFAEIVAREIAQPLGLVNTRVLRSLDDMGSLLPGYSRMWGEECDVRIRYHPGWVSHGLVASSVPEIGKFYDALFRGELVAGALEQPFFEPIVVGHAHEYIVKPSYAFGLMCDPEYLLGPLYGHNGGGPGYLISSFGIPSQKMIFTVLSNSDEVGSDKFLFEILKLLTV